MKDKPYRLGPWLAAYAILASLVGLVVGCTASRAQQGSPLAEQIEAQTKAVGELAAAVTEQSRISGIGNTATGPMGSGNVGPTQIVQIGEREVLGIGLGYLTGWIARSILVGLIGVLIWLIERRRKQEVKT